MGSFTKTLTANEIGVYAGNYQGAGPGTAPAHTAIIDYVFDAAAIPATEDNSGIVGVVCDTGELGACSAGLTACDAGALICERDLVTPPADDVSCDGVDDDCDGSVDDEYVSSGSACGVGACADTGSLTCVAGVENDSCVAGTPAADDVTCDGVDDDCNGATDDGWADAATACGVGACADTGTLTCESGVEVDSCVVGTPAADDVACDGIDDNCDGVEDEGWVGSATACGVGACADTGTLTCESGVEVDSCVVGTPAADDVTCDGVDDNCDGVVDEGWSDSATACGVGACADTGTLTCESGVEVDSCVVGTPAADDVTCDGVDDNCDGTVDEGWSDAATACGVGACADTGTLTCESGVEVDSCVVGTPAADDVTCDGIDDNCNGAVDEGWVDAATACGAGVCADVGLLTCESGVEVDSCVAGAPTGADDDCDGLDQDCDGTADGHYAVTATACGVGACADAGTLTCVAGVEVDSCVVGTPAADDVTCDGVDDNCDGVEDEGWSDSATACGVGACADTGTLTCESGVEVDSCVVGTPAADDVTCDGIDDNCDGVVDEGWSDSATACGVGACAFSDSLRCGCLC